MNCEHLHELIGLQFMPVKADKRPIVKGWQTYSGKHDLSNCEAVGLVCGRLSGGVEVLDIDLKYDLTGDLFDRYKKKVHKADPELLSKLVLQKTKSGGYHLIYRSSKIAGNLKLANRRTTENEREATFKTEYESFLKESIEDAAAVKKARKVAENDKVRVLFETRGEGGQIVTFPSPGYEIVYGDYYSITEITEEQREIIIGVARQFNEVVEEVVISKKETPAFYTKGITPFDDYNQRGDVVALLESHGWKAVGNKGKKTIFLRPGQTTSQSSGNFDFEKNWFSVFTTSSEFEPEKAYLPYSVFAVLECNKDYSEAAKKLYELGYGERREEKKKEVESTRIIKSRINVEDNDLSFLAKPEDYDGYLQQVIDGTLPLGLTTGSPLLDEHFLFKEGNLVMTNGIDNTGKALCLKTPIPTPTGWTTMGELKIGDILFDEQGRLCSVTNMTGIQVDKKCYNIIFSNGEEIVCCEDHLWEVETLGKFKRVLSVKEMIAKGIKQKFKQKTLSSYSITLPKPINMPSRGNFIINPYTLGVWLGDGMSRGNRFATSEKDMDELAKNLCSDGHPAKAVKQKDGQCEIQITGSNTYFTTRLKCLHLIMNKHIPQEYLRASVDERVALLQGLMDTDGTINKRGVIEFCNQNKRLIDGFMELLSSLGLKYSLTERYPKCGNKRMTKKAYYVSFSCDLKKFPVFRMRRKAERMSQIRTRGTSVQIVNIVEIDSVPVKCIEVNSPSRLFLCGKKMIPTHNSVFTWWLLLLAAMNHGWKGVIFSSENTLGAFMRKMIQFYWGKQLRGKYAMSENEFNIAKSFIEDHFSLIKAQEDLYNYKDIINMVKKARKAKMYQYAMIDPYNSLKIDLSGFSKLNTHEYHYEALSEIKSYGQQTNFGWFVNHHAVTAAARAKDAEKKYPLAPNKADTEGGQKVANKADDFITIHRITQHPTDSMITEFHVRKIKDTETGGRPTPIDNPVKFEMYKGGCGFIERPYLGGSAIDPIMEWHIKKNNLVQSEIKIPLETKIVRIWTPYKDDLEADPF
jgi:hypothetical protein